MRRHLGFLVLYMYHFLLKIILNCMYYKNVPFFTMHVIKNNKFRFRPPIFQTIINNDFKKQKKNKFLALSNFTL